MDNREAIKYIEQHGFISDDVKNIAIQAIEELEMRDKYFISVKEELEQYRELGMVEEIKKIQCDYAAAEAILVDEFGMDNAETLQQVREAVGKMKPKKVTDVRYFGEAGYYIGLCPICKQGNNSEYQYCGDCGQKLDWSVEE